MWFFPCVRTHLAQNFEAYSRQFDDRLSVKNTGKVQGGLLSKYRGPHGKCGGIDVLNVREMGGSNLCTIDKRQEYLRFSSDSLLGQDFFWPTEEEDLPPGEEVGLLWIDC